MNGLGRGAKAGISGLLLGGALSLQGCVPLVAGFIGGSLANPRPQTFIPVSPPPGNWSNPNRSVNGWYNSSQSDGEQGSAGVLGLYSQGLQFVSNDRKSWAQIPYSSIAGVYPTEMSFVCDDRLLIQTNQGSFLFNFPNQLDVTSLGNEIIRNRNASLQESRLRFGQ